MKEDSSPNPETFKAPPSGLTPEEETELWLEYFRKGGSFSSEELRQKAKAAAARIDKLKEQGK